MEYLYDSGGEVSTGLNSGDELRFENVGLHCEESCLEENMRLK